MADNASVPSDTERRFNQLLDAADRVALTISAAHGAGGDFRKLASYPALTCIKIERQATVEFRGGLALLRDPVLSWDSEILLRSVLEAAAQMWRIYGTRRSSLASRRRAAVCFEFGSISGLYRSTRPRRDSKGRLLLSNRRYSTEKGRASIRRRYGLMKSLHDHMCPPNCRGVSSSQISEVLINMSKRHRSLRWASSMWEVTSMTAHQTLQRGLAPADPSALEMVPADLPERLSLLDRLVSAYGVSIELAGRIHLPALTAFQVAAVALKKEMTEIRALA